MKKQVINYTEAIRNGIIDFEQASAIRDMDFTEAIKANLLTFEQACALNGMAGESAGKPAPKAKKQVKKAKAPKAEKPKAEKPAKVEEPKGEVSEKPEWSYSKGGLIIQYAGKNTLKANHLRRVNYAMAKLVDAGFCVSWKRVGHYVYIFHRKDADHKTAAEYKAVKLPKGWNMVKGAWVDTDMLKDYADNFRDEQ